jgi:DNA segregation ATPase FtsK/SpoIIIE-like protein
MQVRRDAKAAKPQPATRTQAATSRGAPVVTKRAPRKTAFSKQNMRGSVVSEEAHVIHEGQLQKLSSGSFARYQTRFFQLSGHYIRYYESRSAVTGNGRNLKGFLDLNLASGCERESADMCISMEGGTKLKLRAADASTADIWRDSITLVMEQGRENAAAAIEAAIPEEDEERRLQEEADRVLGEELARKEVAEDALLVAEDALLGPAKDALLGPHDRDSGNTDDAGCLAKEISGPRADALRRRSWQIASGAAVRVVVARETLPKEAAERRRSWQMDIQLVSAQVRSATEIAARVIVEGYLYVKSHSKAGAWEMRWCALDESMTLLVNDNSVQSNMQGRIKVKAAISQPDGAYDKRNNIIDFEATDGVVTTICTESEEAKQEWLAAVPEPPAGPPPPLPPPCPPPGRDSVLASPALLAVTSADASTADTVKDALDNADGLPEAEPRVRSSSLAGPILQTSGSAVESAVQSFKSAVEYTAKDCLRVALANVAAIRSHQGIGEKVAQMAVDDVKKEEAVLESAEEKAKQEAEEKAKQKAKQEEDEKAKKGAEEKAKQEEEEKAKQEAEEKAKQEAEEKAKQEAEAKAKQEAEAEAKQEAEAKAKQEAEAKAKQEAEEPTSVNASVASGPSFALEALQLPPSELPAGVDAAHREVPSYRPAYRPRPFPLPPVPAVVMPCFW